MSPILGWRIGAAVVFVLVAIVAVELKAQADG
jgi:hypothetical protein